MQLKVKTYILFGKCGEGGLVALQLDFSQVATFVKQQLGKEVEMNRCGPITTSIVEPFFPHKDEFDLNIVSDRLGCSIKFSELDELEHRRHKRFPCGGFDIKENWDKAKTIPTGASLTPEICGPLVASLPQEIKGKIGDSIQDIFTHFKDLDFTLLEMNPFTLVDGKPYPLDMKCELDDTAGLKNLKKWGDIDFPMPFRRVMSPTKTFIHGLDEKTSDYLKFTVLSPKASAFLEKKIWQASPENVPRTVQMSWDFENVAVPHDITPNKMIHKIIARLRYFGYVGPIEMNAFVGIRGLPLKRTKKSLKRGGVTLFEAVEDVDDDADRLLIGQMNLPWNDRVSHLLLGSEHIYANPVSTLMDDQLKVMVVYSNKGKKSELMNVAFLDNDIEELS